MRAKDFIEIDAGSPETEIKRLEALYAQLAQETPDVKRRLVADLTAITRDQQEKIWSRFQACNILGGGRFDLGLLGSRNVTRTIREVLETELVGYRRSGFLMMKKRPHLRELDQFSFCFLQVLLLTLLRVDFQQMHKFVQDVANAITDPDQKANMAKLISNAEVKLAS